MTRLCDQVTTNLCLSGKTSIGNNHLKMPQPVLFNIGKNYIGFIIQLILSLSPEIPLILFIRRGFKNLRTLYSSIQLSYEILSILTINVN